MSIVPFQLVNDQTFLPADISDGVIFTSSDQLNGEGADLSTGIRVVVDYHDLQSFPYGASLQAVVEGKSAQGQYYIIAYQFEEFRLAGSTQKRQIVMDPNLTWLDAGIDNIIYVGGVTAEQVSNQQGILPPIWRLRLLVGNPNSFTSARLSIYGERFSLPVIPDHQGVLVDKEGNLVTVEVH